MGRRMRMNTPSDNLANLQRGTYGGGGEKIDWTYYDTFKVVVATLVNRLFTNAIGQAGGGLTNKTLSDTNMSVGGQIPQGQRLHIHALKFFYVSAGAFATADIQSFYTLLKQTTLEFMIQGKDSMLTITLQELLGASTLTAATPTAAGDNIPIIQPRFHGIYPLNTPIILSALTPFEVRITHQVAAAAALADDLLMIGLNGKLYRLS